jgi:hypothetical protein
MRAPTTDRANAISGQDPAVDLLGRTAATEPSHPVRTGGTGSGAKSAPAAASVPLDVLSVTDLAALDDDDDDEGGDLLVVDEFVEAGDDEFEDVAEPSKPQGPVPH